MFKKVKSQKLYMEIVDQIQQLIIDGQLKPGMKLPSENKLAEELGASRPTVREAISALEVMGIVESRKGKGNYIRETKNNDSPEKVKRKLLSESDPYEIFEARLIFEPQIIDILLKNAAPGDLKKLNKYLSLMEKYTRNPDVEKLIKYDILFHETMGEATHNNMIIEIDRLMNNKRKDTLWKRLKSKNFEIPEKREQYLKEHRAIYQAIMENDSERAKEILKEHILALQEDLFTN